MSKKKSDKRLNDFPHDPQSETRLRLVTVAEEQRRLDALRRKIRSAERLSRLRRLDSVFGSSQPIHKRATLN